MTDSFNVTPKTTEQHLLVRNGKSDAAINNNKRLRSMYCTLEANYRQIGIAHQHSSDVVALCAQLTRDLLAIAKFLVA